MKKRRVPFTSAQKELVVTILEDMPENKKIQLEKTLRRNEYLTSTYALDFITFTIYMEGFYIELTGTRCCFKVWVFDQDGNLIFGRKPSENKLHPFISWNEKTDFINWFKYGRDNLWNLEY